MEDAVLLLDSEGRILQWNLAAQRLFTKAVGLVLDLGELARGAVEEWSPAFRCRQLQVAPELLPERPPGWADR
jgi:PAS domain-containing protein